MGDGFCWFSNCDLHLVPRDLSATLEWVSESDVFRKDPKQLYHTIKICCKTHCFLHMLPDIPMRSSLLPATLSGCSGTCHNRPVGHSTISHGVHRQCLWFPLAYLVGYFGVEFLLHFPFVLKRCNKYCFNSVLVSAWVLVLGFFLPSQALFFPKKRSLLNT